MKSRTFFLTLLAAGALAITVVAQNQQPVAIDADKASAILVEDIQAQQKLMSEKQTKIEEKLAAVGEEVRLARIYVSRGGKGAAK